MYKDINLSRRDFIKSTSKATIGGLIFPIAANSIGNFSVSNTENLKVFVFSKHLQFLDYSEMCEVAKEIGFDGIDLTVRPQGHVLPEAVEDDLPLVTEAMKSFDLLPQLITTNVTDANNSSNRKVLEVASKLGYQFYRPDWFRYHDDKLITNTLESSREKLIGLANLNEELGLSGSYQNHSGNFVGSAIWDLEQILEGISPLHMGCQYDIMHATVEGAKNWEIGFRRIKDYINTIVVKDFRWKKTDGKWTVEYCPIGEGMVDFKKFFSLLKRYYINVPVSIHYEYYLGGAKHGPNSTKTRAEIFKRMKEDLEFIRSTWKKLNLEKKGL